MTARHAALVALAVLASSCSSTGQGPSPADPPPPPPSSASAAPQQPAPPPPPVEAAKLSLTAIEPSIGRDDGGAEVILKGSGFTAIPRAVKVYFGTRAAAVLRFNGDAELLVAAPGGNAGEVVDVVAVFEPGGELRLPRAYTYIDATAAAPGAPAQLLGDRNRAVLESLGTGTRIRGAGTGVAALGDFVSGGAGAGTTGPVPSVGHGASQGDFGGFTPDEIDRVIRMRAGLLRACYQKELARKPDLGGKVVVRFKIAADGTVAGITLDDARTTLDDDAVTSCLRRQFQKLRFPAKGPATVTYPLVFASA